MSTESYENGTRDDLGVLIKIVKKPSDLNIKMSSGATCTLKKPVTITLWPQRYGTSLYSGDIKSPEGQQLSVYRHEEGRSATNASVNIKGESAYVDNENHDKDLLNYLLRKKISSIWEDSKEDHSIYTARTRPKLAFERHAQNLYDMGIVCSNPNIVFTLDDIQALATTGLGRRTERPTRGGQ